MLIVQAFAPAFLLGVPLWFAIKTMRTTSTEKIIMVFFPFLLASIGWASYCMTGVVIPHGGDVTLWQELRIPLIVFADLSVFLLGAAVTEFTCAAYKHYRS